MGVISAFCAKKRLVSEMRDYAILIALGFVMTWSKLTCSSCVDSVRSFFIISTFTSLLWIVLWKGNEYLAEYISKKISWIELPIRRFVIGTLGTVVYTFLGMYFLTVIYEWSFGIIIPTGFWISGIITITISLFMHGRTFLVNWRKAAIAVEKIQQESMAARYETLKSQVNPHFLFNSLNALTNLIYEDETKALKFIDQLGLVYEYVLHTREKELVPLSEELQFLESYLYLQRIRFGEKLHVQFHLDGVDTYVAPLALQMLIENAIKHNVVSEEDPLVITLRIESDYIVIENNLQKKTSIGDESSGVGLDNIRKRYDILSRTKVIIIEDREYFRVMLPLIKTEQINAGLS